MYFYEIMINKQKLSNQQGLIWIHIQLKQENKFAMLEIISLCTYQFDRLPIFPFVPDW